MMPAFVSFILRRHLTLGVIHCLSFTLVFERATNFSHRFLLLHGECKIDVTIQDVVIESDKWSMAH